MNVKCNTAVTPKRNIDGVRTKEWFFERARKICEGGDDFSFDDFREITQGNFRQIILRNKDKIERTNRSTFCSYRLKGYHTRGHSNNVTFEGMGVGSNMDEILKSVKGQPPMVHDLKINFKSNLHSILEKKGHAVSTSNKRICLDRWPLGHSVHATISVYPKTVQIDVGCTLNAIIYDISGAQRFLIMLGRVYQIIVMYAQSDDLFMSQPQEWMITNYHFNKDGKNEYSGELFNRTVADFTGGLVRWYTKKWPDGKTRIRQEEIISVNRTVEEECNRMMSQYTKNDWEKLNKLTTPLEEQVMT